MVPLWLPQAGSNSRFELPLSIQLIMTLGPRRHIQSLVRKYISAVFSGVTAQNRTGEPSDDDMQNFFGHWLPKSGRVSFDALAKNRKVTRIGPEYIGRSLSKLLSYFLSKLI